METMDTSRNTINKDLRGDRRGIGECMYVRHRNVMRRIDMTTMSTKIKRAILYKMIELVEGSTILRGI